MIYDRTQADIDEARELRTKLGRGEALTEDEVRQLERGTLTVVTLNRIENKMSELSQSLKNKGNSTNIATKSWIHGDYFYKNDFERWISILDKLKMFAPSLTVDTPTVDEALTFDGINKVEKILVDTEEAIGRLDTETELGYALGTSYLGIYAQKGETV